MKKAEIDQGNLSTSDESENDEREETMGMRHNRRQEHYVDSGHCHVTPQRNQEKRGNMQKIINVMRCLTGRE